MRDRILFAAASLCLLASLRLGAQDLLASASVPDRLCLRLDTGGSGAEWSLAVNKGPPDLRLVREGETEVLEMSSVRSSFGLQRKIALDLGRYRVMSWRWRAEVLPEGGDFRSARKNDQAAQVYVAFSATRAIGYLWDSSAPEGVVGDLPSAPPFMRVKVIVLRSGARDRGTWELERRDLRADYERLFGEAMPAVSKLGLRLWVNSQHTASCAACAFADFLFE
jgi:Protein of unknown function (DUF3047)